MKTRLLVLGGTGLLGNAVVKYFNKLKDRYDLTFTYRNEEIALAEFPSITKTKFDALHDDIHKLHLKNFDYVINCIGLIKPYFNDPQNQVNGTILNSVFPWQLAKVCEQQGAKLIHITTDCVYSGTVGRYNEDANHDCLDAYGKTKSLGEPNNCMVIRTSIIGDEIHNNSSLIAWAKSQKGRTIKGYTHHHWNGMTTTQFADVCHQIIQNKLWNMRLSHLYSNTVTKYELLNLFNDIFDLNLTIEKYTDANMVDRSLTTNKVLIDNIIIPSLKEQLGHINDA